MQNLPRRTRIGGALATVATVATLSVRRPSEAAPPLATLGVD